MMLSRRLATAARLLPLSQSRQPLRRVPLPTLYQQLRTYADHVVKVPQMAESISEGTLKQFLKQVGDYVEQDEEIATIETDKVTHRNRHHDARPRGVSHPLTGEGFFFVSGCPRPLDRCSRQRDFGRYHQGTPGRRG